MKIDELIITFSTDYRFYSVFISKLNKIKDDKLPADAGVGFSKHGQLTLFYNSSLEALPQKRAHGVLVHEMQHILQGHLERDLIKMRPTDSEGMRILKNFAADMTINPEVREFKGEKTDYVFPSNFNLPDNELTEFYLCELLKKYPNAAKPPKEYVLVGDHGKWDKVYDPETGETKDISDLEIDAKGQIEKIVLDTISKVGKGNLPANLQKIVEMWEKRNHIDKWKQELRIFENSLLSRDKRLSQKRVNRRFMNQKYLLPGKKKDKKPTIILGRDTSGSCWGDEVQRQFNEEIIKLASVAHVIVVDCDTEIGQSYTVKKLSDFRPIKGGGGTDFRPVFEFAKKKQADGVIYMTDTYGSFPENPGKFGRKTIWVTFNQEKAELPFGRHLNIEKSK